MTGSLPDCSIGEARSLRYFVKRQSWHLATFLVLVPIAWAFAAPTLGDGAWMGVSDTAWFWLGIGVPMAHQALVWLVWRGQLGWCVFTRLFGRWDLWVWGFLFLPFLAARMIGTLALAMADRGSLMLPRPIAVSLGVVLLAPALYTLWSVLRYFGIFRALGGDHFRAYYRKMPLVKEGAFRWTGNAMYTFAFLALWSIALLVGSQAALSIALFQHAAVWAHYHCTEAPDIALLYRS